jgi:hypothetical protein
MASILYYVRFSDVTKVLMVPEADSDDHKKHWKSLGGDFKTHIENLDVHTMGHNLDVNLCLKMNKSL